MQGIGGGSKLGSMVSYNTQADTPHEARKAESAVGQSVSALQVSKGQGAGAIHQGDTFDGPGVDGQLRNADSLFSGGDASLGGELAALGQLDAATVSASGLVSDMAGGMPQIAVDAQVANAAAVVKDGDAQDAHREGAGAHAGESTQALTQESTLESLANSAARLFSSSVASLKSSIFSLAEKLTDPRATQPPAQDSSSQRPRDGHDPRAEGALGRARNQVENANIQRFMQTAPGNASPKALSGASQQRLETEAGEGFRSRSPGAHRPDAADESKAEALRAEQHDKQSGSVKGGRDKGFLDRLMEDAGGVDADAVGAAWFLEQRELEDEHKPAGGLRQADALDENSRCRGILEDGNRCLRRAQQGTPYCPAHAAAHLHYERPLEVEAAWPEAEVAATGPAAKPEEAAPVPDGPGSIVTD